MNGEALGGWGVLLAVLAGAIRAGTPYLFVSLGECLTEKSGRINLGLEGNLVLGAMSAYAVSYSSGSPWLGVLAAGGTGMMLGLIHAWLCSLPKVNDIAVGIALMLFGTGVAFFLGKPISSRLRRIFRRLLWAPGVRTLMSVPRSKSTSCFCLALSPHRYWPGFWPIPAGG